LKVLVLTDKGKKAISDVKIKKIFNKRGSFEHEYTKFRVGEHLRKKGYWVTYEYKLVEGKTVDLVAEKDGKKTAIEVETGKSDSVYNIKKDLEAEFDEVYSIAINNNIKEKILQELGKLGLNNKKIMILEITEIL